VTADGAKAARAMTLTAFTIGRTVNIHYDTTNTDSPVKIPWINS
jgi:hypothetical protein